MFLYRVLIVWVILQGTPFVRDIFNLPLHDGRSLLIDGFILMFCFCLYVLNHSLKYRSSLTESNADNYEGKIIKCGALCKQYPTERGLAFNVIIFLKDTANNFIFLCKNLPFSYMVLIWIVPGFFIYVSSKINGSTQLFFFKQYLILVALIQLIIWDVKYGRIDSFINTFLNVSILFVFFQTLLLGLNIIYSGAFQDVMVKNSFPIVMLILSEICKGDNRYDMSKRFIIVGAISAIISSVKLFFILLPLMAIINYLRKKHVKSERNRGFFSLAWYISIVFSPFLIPLFIQYMFNIDMGQVIEIGVDRYYIEDNIASLLSRLYSVIFMFHEGSIWTIFGNNESTLSNIIFWGYPVHNLYASLAYSHGMLVFSIFILYNFFIYRFIRHNTALSTILGFSLIYFNDIYPMLSLLFIPYAIHSKMCMRTKWPRLTAKVH
jgi:hypothetical protein